MQEELREAFFDSSTEDVTSKLRGAMDEIDLNGDGGVSLNELLLVGLGRSPSLHVRPHPRRASVRYCACMHAYADIATRRRQFQSAPSPTRSARRLRAYVCAGQGAGGSVAMCKVAIGRPDSWACKQGRMWYTPVCKQ